MLVQKLHIPYICMLMYCSQYFRQCTASLLYMCSIVYSTVYQRCQLGRNFRPGTQNLFSARPGPQSQYYISCTVQFFKYLSKSILLHKTAFPFSARSNTVLPQYNCNVECTVVPVATQELWFEGGTSNKILYSYMNSTQVLYCNGVVKISVRGNIHQKFTHQRLLKKFFKVCRKFAQKFKKFSKIFLK